MPALGWIADREGHKLSLEITAACFACGAALALAANNVTEMYPAVVFANIGMSGIAVSHNLILAEFAPTHTDVPMYTAFPGCCLPPRSGLAHQSLEDTSPTLQDFRRCSPYRSQPG